MEKMVLADIVVSERIERYSLMMELQHKVKAAKKRYEKTGKIKPIEVVETLKGWTLVDGYARFCALTEMDVTEYHVIKREGDYQTIVQEIVRMKQQILEKTKEEVAEKKAERMRQHELRMELDKALYPERRRAKNKRRRALRQAKKKSMESFFWCWMKRNHLFNNGKTKKSDASVEYTIACRILNQFKPKTNELEIYFKHVECNTRVHMRTAVIGTFLELWTQYYEEMQTKAQLLEEA